MAITLTHAPTHTTVTLPDALRWVDEHGWSAVQQSRQYTLTGALVVQEWLRQAGRPITLEGNMETTWCTRAVVQQLHAWAQLPGVVLTLVLRGLTYPVTWDHERGALSCQPVMLYNDAEIDAGDWYVPTLRLVTV